MFNVVFENDCAIIKNPQLFDLKKTFLCGQCFRWDEDENGVWHGIVNSHYINIKEENSDIILYPCTKEDFYSLWYDYFDLGRDYEQINTAFQQDETLNIAREYSKGIRILNQEPWETLCSFIISQNNNIPRIKGIISRLCEAYGEKSEKGYSFPKAEILAKLTIEDLAPLRSGFRAKYIIDAAKKVASGEVNLSLLKTSNKDEARDILTTIYGVGEKVADCTLLFGLGHIDVCPKDVWIKRALSIFYDGDFPDCAKNYAGIAQQYLFYYARETKLNI
ncbi:MAG: DNA glycosylase [Acutalibacteraceae bacterium]|nr:DNA glycosylase [Acutalibacteraceae bacterium]